jgi:hypothetical protein
LSARVARSRPWEARRSAYVPFGATRCKRPATGVWWLRACADGQGRALASTVSASARRVGQSTANARAVTSTPNRTRPAPSCTQAATNATKSTSPSVIRASCTARSWLLICRRSCISGTTALPSRPSRQDLDAGGHGQLPTRTAIRSPVRSERGCASRAWKWWPSWLASQSLLQLADLERCSHARLSARAPQAPAATECTDVCWPCRSRRHPVSRPSGCFGTGRSATSATSTPGCRA